MNRQQVLTWSGGTGGPPMLAGFDDAGHLVALGPADGSPAWLTQWRPLVAAGTQAGSNEWADLHVDVLADEVEQSWSLAGRTIAVRLRHTFDRTWQIRLVVHNTGDAPVSLTVDWSLSAGPGGAVAVHGATGHASVRCAGSDAAQPILQGTLTRGTVGPAGDARIELAPGDRWICAWKVEWVDRGTPPPLPRWWPRDLVAEDEPVEIADTDVVVAGATAHESGWESPAARGTRLLEVTEATRVVTPVIHGVPAWDALAAETRHELEDVDELDPAEALLLGEPARMRLGDEAPALRRLVSPADGPVDVPGFGHGLATLQTLPLGLERHELPRESTHADDLERADRLLLSEPDEQWDALMARLGPVVDAWPLTPVHWTDEDLARWVAVATMARHLQRPGVPDPEPLHAALLARCADLPPCDRATILAWLVLG